MKCFRCGTNRAVLKEGPCSENKTEGVAFKNNDILD